ncbi:Acetyltransferase (GNAT) domain [Propionibacterium ruminifibrarum]|uniref:Acetyltransferase (GNAT) domain n=1 Tax=Propionibacterium ruminifibrarum TaxID=1962131 RepID=A0A375I600_9ACTN|nr:GNAT family N-acetyltransferase [Propionibacterium ruminifibrarum]SPF69269.1 Acetyltransferase (GNAT) domain [Propionibacterium ruminifibrarum]
MEPFRITADGLVLSAPTPDDVDAFARICAEPSIAEWTTIRSGFTAADARRLVTDAVQTGWQTGAHPMWAVRATAGGEPVGMVSLQARPLGTWEIGYWTSEAARGRGVTSRAVRALVDAAFDPQGEIGAERLLWRAEIHDGVPNWASWRIAWKTGFHKQGRLRGAAVNDGRRHDMWLADLLPDDPRSPQAPWDGPTPSRRPRGNGRETVTPTDATGTREGDSPEGLVARFHRVYGLPIVEDGPSLEREHLHMRMGLIAEEFAELVGAVYGSSSRRIVEEAFTRAVAADENARDLVETADALADLVYVVYGMALETGIDLPAVLAEVQRSNMSKLGADGRPLYRADGKVLKGPGFFRPDVAGVLARGGRRDGPTVHRSS